MSALFALEKRSVRVFISSTFRDLHDERDYLMKFVFPEVRAFARTRAVDFVEVDLRWGITEEEAQSGQVLEICLEEIDRSRPYFIGILGQRYGWVPDGGISDRPAVKRKFPWVAEDLGSGISITEMEIQYGVLRNPDIAKHAFFYIKESDAVSEEFRDPVESPASIRLEQLKDSIMGQDRFPHEFFSSKEEIGRKIKRDLMALIDRTFPVAAIPDPESEERRRHAAYGAALIRHAVLPMRLLERLDIWARSASCLPLVVAGASGAGTSTLLTNWMERFHAAHPGVHFFYDFAGATENLDPQNVVDRIVRWLLAEFNLPFAMPEGDYDGTAFISGLIHSIPAHEQVVIVLDNMDRLQFPASPKYEELLPEFGRANCKVLLGMRSTSAIYYAFVRGLRHSIAYERHGFESVTLPLPSPDEVRTLIERNLAFYGKKLEAILINRIIQSPLAGSRGRLRMLLDELRLSARHEELAEWVEKYVRASDLRDFYSVVMSRLEADYSVDAVRMMLCLLEESDAGLTESELQGAMALPRTRFLPILYSIEHLLVRDGELLRFRDAEMKTSVFMRYLNQTHDRKDQKEIQAVLVEYFTQHAADKRTRRLLLSFLLNLERWQDAAALFPGNIDAFPDLSKEEGLFVDFSKALATRAWRNLAVNGIDPFGVVHRASDDVLVRRPAEFNVVADYLLSCANRVMMFTGASASQPGTLALVERAIEICRQNGARTEELWARSDLARMLWFQGSQDRARALVPPLIADFIAQFGAQSIELKELYFSLHMMDYDDAAGYRRLDDSIPGPPRKDPPALPWVSAKGTASAARQLAEDGNVSEALELLDSGLSAVYTALGSGSPWAFPLLERKAECLNKAGLRDREYEILMEMQTIVDRCAGPLESRANAGDLRRWHESGGSPWNALPYALKTADAWHPEKTGMFAADAQTRVADLFLQCGSPEAALQFLHRAERQLTSDIKHDDSTYPWREYFVCAAQFGPSAFSLSLLELAQDYVRRHPQTPYAHNISWFACWYFLRMDQPWEALRWFSEGGPAEEGGWGDLSSVLTLEHRRMDVDLKHKPPADLLLRILAAIRYSEESSVGDRREDRLRETISDDTLLSHMIVILQSAQEVPGHE